MNEHHLKDGKWCKCKDEEPIDSVIKAEANEPSRFSSGDVFVTLRLFIVCRCGPNVKVDLGSPIPAVRIWQIKSARPILGVRF